MFEKTKEFGGHTWGKIEKLIHSETAKKSVDFVKGTLKNDLVKDVALTAGVVAAITVPLPIVGPVTGATIGAALGLYKNLNRERSAATTSPPSAPPPDVHDEILKLDDLRQRGLLTEAEFEKQKRSVLTKGRA
jgi:hypothetical protein